MHHLITMVLICTNKFFISLEVSVWTVNVVCYVQLYTELLWIYIFWFLMLIIIVTSKVTCFGLAHLLQVANFMHMAWALIRKKVKIQLLRFANV